MSRLLHIVLILSVLVTQSAWAIHADELGTGNTDQHFSQPTDQHTGAAESCNHFCHASAHLVGLFSANTIEPQNSCDSHEAALTSLISSLGYQPPIPPPIS